MGGAIIVGDVLVNALLASDFVFAASCLSFSVMSSRLSLENLGEGGREVAAVDSLGDEGTDDESLILDQKDRQSVSYQLKGELCKWR